MLSSPLLFQAWKDSVTPLTGLPAGRPVEALDDGMNPSPEYTPEAVQRAVDGIIAARPSYRGLITFYGRIFAAQEDARPRVRLDTIQLPEDLVRIKRQEQMPLVMASEMVFDPEVSEELLARLCRIAVDCESELAGTARVLSAQLAKAKPLFGPFMQEEEAAILSGAEEMGVDRKALAFFFYHSLRPSICSCACQLSAHLDRVESWNRAYCPVCGSPAGLAWLEGDGSRFLFCSFCWHRWPLERAVCPFCGNRDQGGLSYIYSDEEREYRLDVCESCHTYIKTVDIRNLARPTYPPLEQIASLHLDLKADQAGYKPILKTILPA